MAPRPFGNSAGFTVPGALPVGPSASQPWPQHLQQLQSLAQPVRVQSQQPSHHLSQPQLGGAQQGPAESWAPLAQGAISGDILQAEIVRRQAAEARVRDLEALVGRLRHRIVGLEAARRREGVAGGKNGVVKEFACLASPFVDQAGVDALPEMQPDDAIDQAICEYLERNPDFPVSIQKVAPNYYVFGDRGTVYVTQRGEQFVVRIGGGYKSLQVFMDERALMLTRETAAALSERAAAVSAAVAA